MCKKKKKKRYKLLSTPFLKNYYITATFSQLVFAVRKKKNYLLSLKYKVCLMFLYNAEGLTDVKMKNLVANRLRVKE